MDLHNSISVKLQITGCQLRKHAAPESSFLIDRTVRRLGTDTYNQCDTNIYCISHSSYESFHFNVPYNHCGAGIKNWKVCHIYVFTVLARYS